MTNTAEDLAASRSTFRRTLFDSGLLVDGGVDGLYQRSGAFERIVRGVESRASRAGAPGGGPQLFFPPIMARDAFERTDYLRSFPDLLGAIEVFRGGNAEHAALLRATDEGNDWSEFLEPAKVVLGSAACHALYATLPTTLPKGGLRYEVQGYCFRHEPSIDPARMQSFRQHEFVYIGSPASATEHRDNWLADGLNILAELGLDVHVEAANDPFFGRAGRVLAANQLGGELKFEIMCPVSSDEVLTAITSANYHEAHFGDSFQIRTADGAIAHSACIGFGLERIALALVRRYGTNPYTWPSDVRNQLWP